MKRTCEGARPRLRRRVDGKQHDLRPDVDCSHITVQLVVRLRDTFMSSRQSDERDLCHRCLFVVASPDVDDCPLRRQRFIHLRDHTPKQRYQLPRPYFGELQRSRTSTASFISSRAPPLLKKRAEFFGIVLSLYHQRSSLLLSQFASGSI